MSRLIFCHQLEPPENPENLRGGSVILFINWIIRLNLLHCIVTMSPSNQSNSDNAIIIFDWDDTILPSSFVDRANAENLSELPQQFHNLFREIEQCTEKCLAAAAKHGEVSLSLCYSSGDVYAFWKNQRRPAILRFQFQLHNLCMSLMHVWIALTHLCMSTLYR